MALSIRQSGEGSSKDRDNNLTLLGADMSTNIDVHGVESLRLDDLVRSGSTVWRSLHAYDKDGNVISITFYAPTDKTSMPFTVGGAEDE